MINGDYEATQKSDIIKLYHYVSKYLEEIRDKNVNIKQKKMRKTRKTSTARLCTQI